MKTVRLTLRWTAPRKGDNHPFNPIAHIVPQTFTTLKDGSTLLTPNCMTIREIDEQVDQMISDLQAIRHEAGRLFSKSN